MLLFLCDRAGVERVDADRTPFPLLIPPSTPFPFCSAAHTYSYMVKNLRNETIEIRLDCSGSQNMIPSAETCVVTRTVAPDETAFLLHMQAIKSASNYCGGWKMSWRGR